MELQGGSGLGGALNGPCLPVPAGPPALSALLPHRSSLGDRPSIRLPRGPPTVANLARGGVGLFCSSLRLMTLPGFWPHPPALVTVELCGSVGPAKGSKGWILDQALPLWCGGASDKSL